MKKINVDKIKNLDLQVFENKLKTMATDGDLDSIIEDIEPSPLSENELRGIFQSIKKASIENRILKARKNLPKTTLPFGRHLQWIRNKSGISKIAVAKSLQKDVDFVEKIENGRINPLDIIITELVDLMQLYRICISELVSTIKAFAELGDAKIGEMSAMARSSSNSEPEKKTEAINHAFDSVLQEIAKREKIDKKELIIDKKYIDNLKVELNRRGETSLFK